jgi:hypothetical protein
MDIAFIYQFSKLPLTIDISVTHLVPKALELPPPDDKTLLLARPELGLDTDTDAPPLRRCRTERLARWNGTLTANETTALRANPSDKAWNFMAEVH